MNLGCRICRRPAQRLLEGGELPQLDQGGVRCTQTWTSYLEETFKYSGLTTKKIHFLWFL